MWTDHGRISAARAKIALKSTVPSPSGTHSADPHLLLHITTCTGVTPPYARHGAFEPGRRSSPALRCGQRTGSGGATSFRTRIRRTRAAPASQPAAGLLNREVGVAGITVGPTQVAHSDTGLSGRSSDFPGLFPVVGHVI